MVLILLGFGGMFAVSHRTIVYQRLFESLKRRGLIGRQEVPEYLWSERDRYLADTTASSTDRVTRQLKLLLSDFSEDEFTETELKYVKFIRVFNKWFVSAILLLSLLVAFLVVKGLQ